MASFRITAFLFFNMAFVMLACAQTGDWSNEYKFTTMAQLPFPLSYKVNANACDPGGRTCKLQFMFRALLSHFQYVLSKLDTAMAQTTSRKLTGDIILAPVGIQVYPKTHALILGLKRLLQYTNWAPAVI